MYAIAERIDVAHADNPRLTAWPAEQRERFDDWGRLHGGGRDFSGRSLDRVEALIREHITSVAELFLHEHSPLVQNACWYVGEVHNRTRGTGWRKAPDSADGHPWSERPYVIVPFVRLDEYRDPEGIEYEARSQHPPQQLPHPPRGGLLGRPVLAAGRRGRLRARHRRRRAGRRKGVTP
ncbi:hypothetical protein ACFV6U_30990 [Streptomyces sp. NPDC059810]|uniref:hypothetical protein n=1 Tax=Streptomyces sp. NPDC059810 TaxID=3346956 RepID=UPI003667F955